MLYDNEGYSTIVEKWGNMSSYFVLFAKGAIFVVQGIQLVLIEVHKVLNINYMALSREMEFHADEVAATVAGSAPLANSLLRLDLANSTLSGVFDYYNGKIAEGKKTNNFYPQQSFLLKALSAKEQLPLVDDLPNLSIDAYKKFSKTKLMLDDQWSSHPSTEERVARLLNLNLPVRGDYSGKAINLLKDRSEVEEMITQKLFETVTYEQEPVLIGMDEFSYDYAELERDRYPIIFRGYFDERNLYVDFTDEDLQHPVVDDALSFEEIFGENSAADINSLVIAVSDKMTLERIDDGVLDIKTFDYDGVKYSSADVPELIKFLEGKISSLEQTLDERDKDVFKFFLKQAVAQDRLLDFKEYMLCYKSTYQKMKSQQQVYIDLINGTQFLQKTTPFSEIARRIEEVKKLEVPFKEEIRLMLEDPDYAEMIDAEMRARFDEYLSHNWKYFANDMYFDKELEVLFAALGDFYSVAFKLHFKLKKAILEFQAGMIENKACAA
ncbi:MAG: hypothetical protein EOO88_17160 [Pedobacter sp.]|nr:MAG: hypothetical protein EOO88_17160 [Pedobacter sp.]